MSCWYFRHPPGYHIVIDGKVKEHEVQEASSSMMFSPNLLQICHFYQVLLEHDKQIAIWTVYVGTKCC